MLSSLLLATVLSVRTVGSTIWQPYIHDQFLPIMVHGHTTICFPIFPLFPCICYSAGQHTHSTMSLYVLFSCPYCTRQYDVLHCLIKLFTVCIYYPFLFVTFLSRDIWFGMPDRIIIIIIIIIIIQYECLLSQAFSSWYFS